jgi:hypothetical protein
MAKRENRIAPLEHEMRQITNLKTLQPIATPPEVQPFSDCLLDIAVAALEEAVNLESGQPIQLKRLTHLMELVDQMTTTARGDAGETG